MVSETSGAGNKFVEVPATHRRYREGKSAARGHDKTHMYGAVLEATKLCQEDGG